MEPLSDPAKNRAVKDLPPPPHRPLPKEILFKNNKINCKVLKDFLRKEGIITEADFKHIIKTVKSILCTLIFSIAS